MHVDRSDLLGEVAAERVRQDAKWGGIPGEERRDDHTYAAVLGEEFGECCKAWLERDPAALRSELIQTAAVALAWVEELDNTRGATRSRFARLPTMYLDEPHPLRIGSRHFPDLLSTERSHGRRASSAPTHDDEPVK